MQHVQSSNEIKIKNTKYEIAMIDKSPIGIIISINHGVFHLAKIKN